MTCSGYTVVTCAAAGCGLADDATVGPELVTALREVVRASGHGVLVGSGCMLRCAHRPVAPVVVVQPCDDERRPTSCALAVGPLRTAADVDSCVAWLGAGDLDPRLLPPHLLDAARRAALRAREERPCQGAAGDGA